TPCGIPVLVAPEADAVAAHALGRIRPRPAGGTLHGTPGSGVRVRALRRAGASSHGDAAADLRHVPGRRRDTVASGMPGAALDAAPEPRARCRVRAGAQPAGSDLRQTATAYRRHSQSHRWGGVARRLEEGGPRRAG